jgi:hypothetical protein|tara:strand:- start:4247 stop:4522 length:276 start_codon:yes stop_codon:yes gene_type:complete
MFKQIKDWCVPPFTEEEIAKNVQKAKMREVVKWTKHLSDKGSTSINKHSFKHYQGLLNKGYVMSEVSYGERKGELCLYNRKSDDTIFAEDY